MKHPWDGCLIEATAEVVIKERLQVFRGSGGVEVPVMHDQRRKARGRCASSLTASVPE